MTLEYFLLLLMIVSIFTGLVTEGIKKLLEESKKTYKANFLAGGVAVVLSVGRKGRLRLFICCDPGMAERRSSG